MNGATPFDTLSASKELQNAGMDATQAEAIAMVVKGAQGNLVTKADLESVKTELKNDIQRLEDKISNLRWTVIVVAGVVVALIKFLP